MKNKEIFKDILEYEGLYQISNLGTVKSLGNNKRRKEKILKCYIDDWGYKIVILSKNNKTKLHFIHRLIAQAFISNPLNKPQINHIDCNKINNNINNLEWCTDKENKEHSVKNKMVACGEKIGISKLTEKEVKEIISLKGKEKSRNLAKKYNVSYQTIDYIFRGEIWKHISKIT